MPQDPRDREIAELKAQLSAAMVRIEELEAMLRMNSSNSSKPPSSDIGGHAHRQRRGGKRGARPGHKGHQRLLFPPEKVTRVRKVAPKQCSRCGSRKIRPGANLRRHQVVDLPSTAPDVTEYQLVDGCCEACGKHVRATLPLGVPIRPFGPKLVAVVSALVGRCRLPRRSVKELMRELFGIPISLGGISSLESSMSAALEGPVREAMAHIRNEPVVHPDETGWRQKKRKAWLWVVRARDVTVFRIARSRGAGIAKRLLGKHFRGISVSDRWCAYSWIALSRRQLCWAHLKRDFASMADRQGLTRRYGKSLGRLVDAIFTLWHEFREDAITRQQLCRRIAPLRKAIGRVLRLAVRRGDSKAQRTSRDLLRMEEALWTFTSEEGVEPTNNAAERAIRPAVIWRKTSFGTDSAEGSRFAERMLTVCATLNQQGRNLFQYLESAYRSYLAGRPGPSLLPTPLAEA